jgi:hypothetical protein
MIELRLNYLNIMMKLSGMVSFGLNLSTAISIIITHF